VRRATAALLGTVVGTALLVGAKYATTPPTDPAAGPVEPAAGGGPAAEDAPEGTTTPAAGPGPTKAGGTPTAGPRTTATRTAGPPPPPPTTGGTGSCTTVSGNPVNVSNPGTGAVTVTIKVCNGAITTASSSLSRSNWGRNSSALPALNSLTVQYYKTNISQIHYSGATLTSNAYQGSLRSAIGKAGM
jgi:hypothetical protein